MSLIINIVLLTLMLIMILTMKKEELKIGALIMWIVVVMTAIIEFII